jgi:arylsulfatase A-like enzyme
MKQLGSGLERFGHGALAGAALGLALGATDYILIALRHPSRGGAAALREVLLPYGVVGLTAALMVAAAVQLVSRGDLSLREYIGRVWASVVALACGAALALSITYWLGPPLLRPAIVAGCLAALAVAIGLWLGLHRLLGAALAGLERRSGGAASAFRVRVPLALVALIVVSVAVPLAVGAASPGPGRSAAPAGARPNIVFILIDTLRADHLPFYGYSRQTAPNLTALSRESATFTKMYAQAASTKPSVATLFSSVYPALHHVHDNADFLPDSYTVLAEVLQKAGYRTFGISANANVSPTFGYAQGFDEFRVTKTDSPFRLTFLGRVAEDAIGTSRLGQLLGEHREIVPRAETITDQTLEWVERNRQGPLFLYVQYIDPHYPYEPPAPYDQQFDHRKEPGRRRGGVDPLALIPASRDRAAVGETLDRYDGEILYNDAHLGRLLQGLRAMDVLRDAIIVVTSDHGEEFYEHGNEGHGKSLYEEVVHVPFVMAWPGRIAPANVDRPVGLIDVMPTLLELTDIPTPAAAQGVSFAGDLRGTAPAAGTARKLFGQVSFDRLAFEMVLDGTTKLIRNLRGPRAGRDELYDLATDPLERTEISAQAPRWATQMREELSLFNAFVTRLAPGTTAQRVQKLDRDTERALRSLGYVK